MEQLEGRRLLEAHLGQLAEVNPEPAEPASLADETGFERFGAREELAKWLLEDALKRYAEQFGEPTWYGWYRGWGYPEVMATDLRLDATTNTVADADHSTTNTQVAGVDEADLVETDGRSLFMVHDGSVVIVDVSRADGQLSIRSRVPVEGQIQGIYLHGNRLTVVASAYPEYLARPLLLGDAAATDRWQIPAPGEILKPSTSVEILDVSDPSAPTTVERIVVDGSYQDSRLTGDTVYLVTRSGFTLPGPEVICETDLDPPTVKPLLAENRSAAVANGLIALWEPPFGDGWNASRCHYETADAYRDRWAEGALEELLPAYRVFDAAGAVVERDWLVAPEAVYKPLDDQWDALLAVSAIDVAAEDPGIVDSEALPSGWSSTIYVTEQSLYAAERDWGSWWDSPATDLVKFDLEPAGIELAASGRVAGELLNQFAMDEFDGYLRIATQDGTWQVPHSNLFVLAQDGTSLSVVGAIDDLAPGERLYSARFMGERGYLVTFGPESGVWADPLFTVDLSDPNSPAVVGELEIPGFANYLQQIDAAHLIGLGRDADPETGWSLEPQVLLYDITDFAEPMLQDRQEFGWRFDGSAAFGDHHAISYFAEYGVFAVPLVSWTPWLDEPVWRANGDPARGADLRPEASPYALWVFQVDVDADPEGDALRVLGRIEHSSEVLRSLRVEDRLISVSRNSIQVHRIDDPASKLAELHLDAQERMVRKSVADLAERLGVPSAAIDVVDVRDVNWPDSCLGVPDPGQMCVAVITPGFRIVLEHDDTRYVYHTDRRDTVLPVERERIEPLVQVRLEVRDADGQLVSQVQAGESFTLNVLVDDLRDDPQGVFAAYLDILYQSQTVAIDGEVVFGESYPNGASADLDRIGLIDELGAFGGLDPLGGGELLVASIPLRALRAGVASFVVNPADERGHEVLVYGLDVALRPRQVAWQGTRFEVLDGWHNEDRPSDVNNDGDTTPQDALELIRRLNLHGPLDLHRQAAIAAAGEARRAYLDVLRDGQVTAQDVLCVVNDLNVLAGLGPAQRQRAEPAVTLAEAVDWQRVAELFDESAWKAAIDEAGARGHEVLDAAFDALSRAEARITRTADGVRTIVADGRQAKDRLCEELRPLAERTREQLPLAWSRVDQLLEEFDVSALLAF